MAGTKTSVRLMKDCNVSLAEQRELQQEDRPTSLGKALRLLRQVAACKDQGAKLSWLARREGLARATAHRLLRDLVSENFLSFDPYTKVYRIGHAVGNIAAAASPLAQFDSLRAAIAPALEQIARTLGDSTYLSVLCQGQALCIDRKVGSYPLTVNTLDIGAYRPLGAGGGSLALLAALPPDNRDRVISENADLYERYGKLSKAKVTASVKQFDRDGYTFNRAFIIPEVGAIGLPFFDSRGELAGAVSVATVLTRLNPTRRREMVTAVRHAVLEAGYQPSPTPETFDAAH